MQEFFNTVSLGNYIDHFNKGGTQARDLIIFLHGPDIRPRPNMTFCSEDFLLPSRVTGNWYWINWLGGYVNEDKLAENLPGKRKDGKVLCLEDGHKNNRKQSYNDDESGLFELEWPQHKHPNTPNTCLLYTSPSPRD